MIDQLPPDVVYVAGVALVATLVAARLYAPGDWFSEDSRFWAPVRRLAVPLLHRVFTNADGDLYAETDVGVDERVATLQGVTVDDVLDDLAAAGYRPQPLASFASDWAGRPEAASWARYHGSKLYPGAPEWLRRRQVHVRLFEVDDHASITGSWPDGDEPTMKVQGRSAVIVTAHEEPTSWRPDLWRAHYSGRDVSIERGVRMAAKDLDIERAPKSQDHE
jgi:hypothetical protein